MPLNRDQLMRIRTIDRCLRRRYRLWTIEDLRKACEEALYDYEGISEISLRTVQRDIQLMRSDKLGMYAPIVVTDRKYYSYSDPNYSVEDRPLSPKDIAELNSALDIIRHYSSFKGLKRQDDILTRLQDEFECQGVHKQIIFIETNERLKGIEFLGELYDHTVQRHRLRIMYRPYRHKEASCYNISPYCLKEFNNRWFLVGYSHDVQDIRTLALDRMESVEWNRDEKFMFNTFFEPKSYFGEMVGVSREVDSVPERVVLRIDASQVGYAITKPMHSSQKIQEVHEDGSVTFTLDVILNHELEQLIMSNADRVEVISPLSLRTRIATLLHTAASKY